MGTPNAIQSAGHALIDQVANWLMSQALGDGNVEDIFEGCCTRLLAAGIPLSRAIIMFRTLHPLFASVNLIWRRGKGADVSHILHDQAFTSVEWKQSPMNHLLQTQIPFLRRRLVGDNALMDFPVLAELKEQGATDYLAYITPFAAEGDANPNADGIIGSFATDRSSGFSDDDIHALLRIQQRLVVSCKVQIKDQVATDVLNTYLGSDARRQVLAGQIKRGDGETIHAIIWYSDMRNSTRLADSLEGSEFLSVLNTYFECTAGAVLASGGEVLRFVGDAVLAIFPIRSDGDDEAQAAARAIEAAKQAENNMAKANQLREGDGHEPLGYGVGLHLGDVMFGNIGVPERLEFSVIGSAANEVARLENLTKQLGQRVLVSSEFARALPLEWEPLGSHGLRGVGDAMEVFGIPPHS